MNGVNIKIHFIRINKTVNVNISNLLTLNENIRNVLELLNIKLEEETNELVVYSKYDDIFIDPSLPVSKLNIYSGCYLYVY